MAATISNLRVTANAFDHVSLAWDGAADGGFLVKRSTVPLGTVHANTFTDPTVKPVFQYAYEVTALDPLGPSPAPQLVDVTTPAAPAGGGGSDTDVQVDVNVDAPGAGATFAPIDLTATVEFSDGTKKTYAGKLAPQ